MKWASPGRGRVEPSFIHSFVTTTTYLNATMLGATTSLFRRPHVRRQLTSTFFVATFVGSIVTVFVSSSSSTNGGRGGLPCPARRGGANAEGKQVEEGERGLLTLIVCHGLPSQLAPAFSVRYPISTNSKTQLNRESPTESAPYRGRARERPELRCAAWRRYDIPPERAAGESGEVSSVSIALYARKLGGVCNSLTMYSHFSPITSSFE